MIQTLCETSDEVLGSDMPERLLEESIRRSDDTKRRFYSIKKSMKLFLQLKLDRVANVVNSDMSSQEVYCELKSILNDISLLEKKISLISSILAEAEDSTD